MKAIHYELRYYLYYDAGRRPTYRNRVHCPVLGWEFHVKVFSVIVKVLLGCTNIIH